MNLHRLTLAAAMVLQIAATSHVAAQDGQGSDALVALGTMAPGTISHSTGMAVASVVAEHGVSELRVLPHSGEALLLDLVAQGDLDFAIVNAVEAETAVARGQSDLRVAAVLYPLHVGLFVRTDSDLQALGDLKGRRVTAGFGASPAIARLLEALLASGELSPDDITPVRVADIVTGAERFADGRADAFFFALGAAKLLEVSASRPIRLLPLPDDSQAEARLQAVTPAAYVSTVMPRPGLPGLTEPTPTLTFDNLLVTRADTPDATVQDVLAALASGKAALVGRLPIFAGMDPAGFVKPGMDLPVHPAAAAWEPQ